MPETIRTESVKTITGVPKNRVQFLTQQFLDAGAYSVESWEDPLGSGNYTVSATFIE